MTFWTYFWPPLCSIVCGVVIGTIGGIIMGPVIARDVKRLRDKEIGRGSLPMVRPGDPITASHMNAVTRSVNRGRRMGT